jgi:hypothetical protein
MTSSFDTKHRLINLAVLFAALALVGCGDVDEKPLDGQQNTTENGGNTSGEEPEPEPTPRYEPDPDDTRTARNFFIPFRFDDDGNITSYYFARPTSEASLTCAEMFDAGMFPAVFSVEIESFTAGEVMLSEGLHYFEDESDMNLAFRIGASEGTLELDAVDFDANLASGTATFMVGDFDSQRPEEFSEETYEFADALICY